MDFTLDREHKLAQELFRSFAETEVAPFAQDFDAESRFPEELVKQMQSYGFMGIPFAKEYGGQGCDVLTYILCVEEMAKACGSTATIVSAHTSLCADLINKYANEEQKKKYLTPLANGEKLGAFALTEADAGTDAGAQNTHAVLDGDEWVLNGSKIFITNASKADIYIVIAKTNPDLGSRGLSAFIVEKGTPGLSFGPLEKKMGIHASATGEVIMIDCRIPKENLIGKENGGFKIALGTLDGGRIGIAAVALGIAQGALDKAVAYVKERKQFGRPIAKFQNTQFKLAEMATEVDAARYLVYRAAIAKDKGENYGIYAAMAKLKASEVASWVAAASVQLHGGYGYMQDYDVERMMRDAKITEIYEGTSEVMRMVIGGNILG